MTRVALVDRFQNVYLTTIYQPKAMIELREVKFYLHRETPVGLIYKETYNDKEEQGTKTDVERPINGEPSQ